MKIAIVGTRDFPPAKVGLIRQYVYSLPLNTVIVSGGARGVDSFAEHFARERGMGVIIFRPNWKPDGKYDPTAGFKRNTLIVAEADEIVAFWDGKSTGTQNTIEQATAAGKKVTLIDYLNL